MTWPGRAWLAPGLRRLLRRDPHEIERRAAGFRIAGAGERERLARLGAAFVAGYNTMLDAAGLPDVARAGRAVAEHERPFFFEGAAMGYLPRGWYRPTCSARHAERDLLGLDPSFLYLYYVGLGFWLGFRHRRRPERLARTTECLDRRYAPLCFDGFGFKLGFFDHPGDLGAARSVLDRCPAADRAAAWQGFGRAQHFALMDDEAAFDRLRDAAGDARGTDLESGRALAFAFTRVDRPAEILGFLSAAPGSALLDARLTGVSWALAARRLAGPDYFEGCMARCADPRTEVLRRLPELCADALRRSADYASWQALTRREAALLWNPR